MKSRRCKRRVLGPIRSVLLMGDPAGRPSGAVLEGRPTGRISQLGMSCWLKQDDGVFWGGVPPLHHFSEICSSIKANFARNSFLSIES